MYADELKQKVIQLKGIGKGSSEALAKIGIRNVSDLLRHIPRTYENRKDRVLLSDYREGYVNTIVEITGQDYMGFGRKRTLKVFIKDKSGTAVLICFGRNFLSQKLITGKKFFLYGNFEYRFQELQASSFEVEEFSDNPAVFNRIIPIYPLRDKLTQGVIRRAVSEAISELAQYTHNQLPKNLVQKYNFINRNEAVKNIHFPESLEKLKKAEDLLRYEELFYLQLTVGRRSREPRRYSRSFTDSDSKLQKQLINNLEFTLTPDQFTVLEEINQDMESYSPMARLLQGDVGSGKTLVAFLAALKIIESQGQVAFMVPTELLARQHAENAARLLEPLGVRLAFLRGNIKDKHRLPLLDALKKGEIDLVVGTHALFTKNVEFKNLQFVIVDEQHKFGVHQRAALLEKGDTPDLLLMTATPIPRTLTLTLFGDMDVSVIKTMPIGRKPVITHLSVIGKEDKVYSAVKTEIDKGHQAYFVYPRIETNNSPADLKDAEGMYKYLREEVFPYYHLGLIHSQLPEEEKIKTMELFSSGKIDILVSTSVVEVGVDIPNASCMVVEHAEQFGLAGLHQLRGRVGRGKNQSYAFLVYAKELTETGKQRLKIMMDYNDGFSIAEEDLKLRGPGELAGRRQSGFLNLTYADLVRDFEILERARDDAGKILDNDPGFLLSENSVIREVFDRCSPFKGAIDAE
ncbi:MAG: ATP-dependent DNA helicase RecG [Spirochaetales bacterium]|nr:ATP-dependent DNA helicase RecG [Spirochaetales bacterium]